MIFRIYWTKAGGHIHMRFFAGKQEGALGKCGDLCMRSYEFDEFRARAEKAEMLIDFREEQA